MTDMIRQKIRMTLTKTLLRVRQSHVFPLPFEEVYSAATGDQFAKAVKARAESPGTPQLQNLLSSVSFRDVIHFTLDDPFSYWERHREGYDDPATLFWLRAPRDVPGPQATRAFVLPDRLRGDVKIRQWMSDCTRLQGQINMYTTLIYEVSGHIANSTEFCMAWPEVANAVPAIAGAATVAGRQTGRIRSIRQVIDKAFGPKTMEHLTSLLASGILLPDQRLGAWVEEYSEGPFREEVP